MALVLICYRIVKNCIIAALPLSVFLSDYLSLGIGFPSKCGAWLGTVVFASFSFLTSTFIIVGLSTSGEIVPESRGFA